VILDELVQRPVRPAQRVPGWTLGSFRRRAITYFTGQNDTSTQVFWLQSHGLTADLRLPAGLPRLAAGAVMGDAAPELLLALADVEGGLASTRWNEAAGAMAWSDWTSFAVHDKWPEPGRLARVGDCLIEHAPSGAYVEDWRLQPSAPGPLIGLRLVEQRNLTTGQVDHRGGGLVVCGDHAALVLGRPQPLETGGHARIDAFVRAHLHDRAAMRAVFAFETSVGRRAAAGEDFTVAASTNPTREGRALGVLTGFSRADDGGVRQRVATPAGEIERVFSIDTIEPDFAASLATPATAAAQEWLAREARTLLAGAELADAGLATENGGSR
jgi:hypothetical protein